MYTASLPRSPRSAHSHRFLEAQAVRARARAAAARGVQAHLSAAEVLILRSICTSQMLNQTVQMERQVLGLCMGSIALVVILATHVHVFCSENQSIKNLYGVEPEVLSLPRNDRYEYEDMRARLMRAYHLFSNGDCTNLEGLWGSSVTCSEWKELQKSYAGSGCMSLTDHQSWSIEVVPFACTRLIRRYCALPGEFCIYGFVFFLQMEFHVAGRVAVQVGDRADWKAIIAAARGLAFSFHHGVMAEVVRTLARDNMQAAMLGVSSAVR